MNHVYRLIWNHATQCLVAVSETARGRGKNGGTAKRVAVLAASGALIFGVAGVSPVLAQTVTSDQPNGLTYSTTLSSFNNQGARISTNGIAVNISGNVTGTFTNSGDIQSGDSHGAYVSGSLSGGFTNAASGRIMAQETAALVSGGITGTSTNAGAIDASSHGLFASAGLSGGFTNSGALRAYGMGLYLGAGTATVTRYYADNNGFVFADLNALYAARPCLPANFSCTSYTTTAPAGAALTGNLINNGDIYSYDSHGVFLAGSLDGAFTNSSGARLIANDMAFVAKAPPTYEPFIDTGGSGPVVRDRELFSGVALNGSFNNAGDVIAGNCHGVLIQGQMTGTFTNSGRLYANDFALSMGGNLTGNLTNSGLIVSGDSDAFRGGGNITGLISNSGRMYANDSVFGFTTNNSAYATLSGGFNNSGTMVAGSHGLMLNGVLSSNFVNTATGRIVAAGGYGLYLNQDTAGGQSMIGNLTNQGVLIGGSWDGVAMYDGMTGSFLNSSTGLIAAHNRGVIIAENQTGSVGLTGSFTNAGRIYAGAFNDGAAAVAILGGMTGNFDNQSTGVLLSTSAAGVAIGGNLTGNFNNAGLIVGSAKQNLAPGANWSYFLGPTEYFAPAYLGPAPMVGVLISGNVTGSFTNSGTIAAGQGVFITGNLSGGWDNTGTILGGYTGKLATTYTPGMFLTDSRVLTGDAAVIGGNYSGNFRTGVGQGIRVGTYLHNWQLGDGTVPEDATVVLQSGTGTANLTGDTVAVHVGSNSYTNGYQWTGIKANSLIYAGGAVQDNSSLYNFTAAQVGNDLVFTTIKLDVAAPSTLVNFATATNGLSYNGPQVSFTNAAGVMVLNGGGHAVEFTSADLGSFSNAGRILTSLADASAVAVSGDLAGNFTNASTGLLAAKATAILVTGSATGNFLNDGEIYSGESHGISFAAGLTGNFTNAATGLIVANDLTLNVLGNLSGNFSNAGMIVSGDSHAVYISGSLLGSFSNSAGAAIHANDMSVFVIGDISSSVTNSGEIVSTDCHAIFVSGALSGGFTNAAGATVFGNDIAVRFGSLANGFTNNGEIISGACHAVHINGAMTGNFVNSATGFIVGNDMAVNISGALTGGFTNGGQLIGGDSHSVYINGVMTGNFANQSGALIWANDNGVQISNGISGAFSNAGEISAGGHGVQLGSIAAGPSNAGSFTNVSTGTIAAKSIGVVVCNALTGNFTNQGSISSTDSHGVYVGGLMTGDFTNSAGAKIIAEENGVQFNSGLTGDFDNTGAIYSLNSKGVAMRGAMTGDFTNSGIITGQQRGLSVETTATTGGYTNTTSGQIVAAASSGVGVYVEASAVMGTLTNAGLIAGGNKSLDLQNSADAFVVNNTGILQGDIYLGINTLNLAGNVARVIGDTRNTGGTVNVNGEFTSEGIFDVDNFNITANGIFHMRHAIGGVNQAAVSNLGILELGDATRSITGTYTQGAGATLRFGLTNASTYGKLTVSGNATLTDGGKVDVVVSGMPGARIDGILVAGGTLTTTPANLVVTDNSLFYDFTASTARTAQELDLIAVAAPNPLTNAVRTGNNPAAVGVASALESMFASGIPAAMQPVFNALGTMTAGEVNNALSQLVPAVQGATSQAGMNALHSMNKIIQARIESNQGLSSGDAPAERYMWVRGFGNWGQQDDLKGVSGFKSNTTGFVIGGDVPGTDKIRAGGGFTYARSDIKSNSTASPSNVDVDTYELVGYASYNIDPHTDINVQLDVGQNRAESKRLVFGGGTAQANFSSLAGHGSIGIGRVMPLAAQTNVTPSVRLDYTQMRTKGYTESGATLAGANLKVDASTFKEFLITGDVKFAHQMNEQNKLVGNISAGYDFLNKQVQTTSSFVGGGPTFETKGLEVSPWLYRAGIGLIHDDKKGMEYSVRYDLETRSSGYLNQTLSAKLRWAF
jgi:hypothetical protein